MALLGKPLRPAQGGTLVGARGFELEAISGRELAAEISSGVEGPLILTLGARFAKRRGKWSGPHPSIKRHYNTRYYHG